MAAYRFHRSEKCCLRKAVRDPSEITLALLLFHRTGFVVVDEASLPLGHSRLTHFRNDRVEAGSVRTERTGQRITAECPKADAHHLRCLPGPEGQTIIVDHDQSAVAFNNGPIFGKIKRNDGDILGSDVLPDVKLRPIRQWKYTHRFTGLDARIEQLPELGPLIAWIPAVSDGAMREYPLL